jgi:tetratricopeptide (TPR) repeat protein
VPAALVIIAAVAAAYSNSFSGPFIFDDVSAIQKNATIRSLRSAAVLMPPGKVTLSRRPLANLSFAVNYAIGRLAVRSYHAGNLLIHLLAALTLFGIVRRTLLLPALRDRFGGAATGLAAAVALIWALHPLQTESVTYIVQRAESLMGLCYLLTLYAVIRGASSERPWPWYAGAVIVCALGMGAKEVIATAPIVLLLYDRAFLAGSFRETFRRRGGLYLGLAATWAVFGAMMLLYKGSGAAGFGISTVTPWRYALTQPGVILHYLGLSFWPQSLCLDYPWPFAATFEEVAPEVIALAALLAATAWAVVRRPALGFLGAWFFLILAPTSSVMPIKDACFEHRMYLSLAAVVAGAVIAGYALIRRLARQSALSDDSAAMTAVVLAMAVAAALGWATFRRNADYRTEVSIWEDATRKQPGNCRAWSSLGEAYVSASRYDDAIRSCDRALAVDPNFPPAYDIRGLARAGAGRLSESIRDYDKAIALKPDFAAAYNSRGVADVGIGRLSDAIADYDKAIALKPDFAEAFNNRGLVYATMGRLTEAVRDYDKALDLDPDYATAYNSRGNARADAHRDSEAIADYDRAIALKPDFAEAYNNRGGAYARSARSIEALRDFDEAVALRPDYAGAYYNRARLHFQRREYGQALADVKTYEKLGGRPDPGFVQSLVRAADQSRPLRP